MILREDSVLLKKSFGFDDVAEKEISDFSSFLPKQDCEFSNSAGILLENVYSRITGDAGT